jgi:hypothetical protein
MHLSRCNALEIERDRSDTYTIDIPVTSISPEYLPRWLGARGGEGGSIIIVLGFRQAAVQ